MNISPHVTKKAEKMLPTSSQNASISDFQTNGIQNGIHGAISEKTKRLEKALRSRF